MKNKMLKIVIISLIILVAIIIGIIVFKSIGNVENNSLKSTENGMYQIRFSDLVSVASLEKYNNKIVTAIGYLSPVMGYDGSFGYLMNLPYQTCPYCQPSDTKITNTIAIFAKKGKTIDFTEAAVKVKGTLKLELYTDSYGYSYKYRLINVEIEQADTSLLGDKIELYNKLAEKNVLASIMDVLYAVDNNVYCDEYIANGYDVARSTISLTKINKTIEDLKSFDQTKIGTLIIVSNRLREIAEETNELIEKGELEALSDYKEEVYNMFYTINNWMSTYQL